MQKLEDTCELPKRKKLRSNTNPESSRALDQEDTVQVGHDILYRPGTLSYILLSVFIKSDLEHAQPSPKNLTSNSLLWSSYKNRTAVDKLSSVVKPIVLIALLIFLQN